MKTYLINGVEVSHDNLKISDWTTLNEFLLNEAGTINSLDEDIKDFIFTKTNNNKRAFQVAGDDDGLGFVVDIFKDETMEKLLYSEQYWFEDYIED